MEEKTRKLKVFITEDDRLVRDAYRLAIELESDLEVCGVSETANDTLKYILDKPVDVLLTDLSLPDMDGLELIPLIRKIRPTLPVVVVSGFARETYETPARAVGATSYVNKSEAADVLGFALRDAVSRKDILP